MHGLIYTSLSFFSFFHGQNSTCTMVVADLGPLGFSNECNDVTLPRSKQQRPASSLELQPPSASEWRGAQPGPGGVAGSDRALQLVAASVGPKFVVLGWKQA